MANIQDCQLVPLPRISDTRGNLAFIHGHEHVPFEIKRVYYLFDVPSGAERGGHAHRQLFQLLVPLAGSFDVTLDDGRASRAFTLNRPFQGLLVPPMIWRDLGNFSAGSVCLVLASEIYQEPDYIRDYDNFIEQARR